MGGEIQSEVRGHLVKRIIARRMRMIRRVVIRKIMILARYIVISVNDLLLRNDSDAMRCKSARTNGRAPVRRCNDGMRHRRRRHPVRVRAMRNSRRSLQQQAQDETDNGDRAAHEKGTQTPQDSGAKRGSTSRINTGLTKLSRARVPLTPLNRAAVS